ncbi:MAG: hypothetical protein PHE12_04110, partial [Clostridia bacterium]|nr:hypothetical protein [Clostridia bacterium]
MKRASRKIIVSVVVLVIALSLAITSTYAWFTMSSDPVVEGFDINVTTSNGLLIRSQGIDGETHYQGNLKSRISAEEILAYLFGDDDEEKYPYYPGK